MYTLYSVGASEKLNLTGFCAVCSTLSKRSMQATQFIDCVQHGMCFVATMSSLGLSYVLSCSPFVSMKSYKILLAPSRAQSFSELLRCDTFTFRLFIRLGSAWFRGRGFLCQYRDVVLCMSSCKLYIGNKENLLSASIGFAAYPLAKMVTKTRFA